MRDPRFHRPAPPPNNRECHGQIALKWTSDTDQSETIWQPHEATIRDDGNVSLVCPIWVAKAARFRPTSVSMYGRNALVLESMEADGRGQIHLGLTSVRPEPSRDTVLLETPFWSGERMAWLGHLTRHIGSMRDRGWDYNAIQCYPVIGGLLVIAFIDEACELVLSLPQWSPGR